ncbi:MAG: tetratricopeptide repeat protein [Duodenibacillus sp.]|nr:tetratricopeptide repeat protein [Duodenibacillus sp.]
MNNLWIFLAAAALVPVLALALYTRSARKNDRLFVAGFCAVLLALSASVYGTLGRWADWQTQRIDNDAAHLLTAKITEAQRRVKNMPGNSVARMQLAEAYFEAGQYARAVDAYDECLKLDGGRAETLGKKAYALWYRDGRKLTQESRSVIDAALAKNPLEVQTLMLLGQDAYMRERWSEAIGYWKRLLDSGAARAQERALLTAIANAESRARKQD